MTERRSLAAEMAEERGLLLGGGSGGGGGGSWWWRDWMWKKVKRMAKMKRR